ncbi:MAG: hypothetical protein IID58_14190 [Proteobacteria bacterium]|nr:hypothetical protein [Pseudomonadota bacterium]
MADYVFELKKLDPTADGNWSFAAIASDNFVTFSSSLKAQYSLPVDSPIVPVGRNENGSGKYRIRF